MPAGRSLIIVSDAFALAETALARMVKRIEDVTHEVTTSGVAICLTGGSTPKHMYSLMAQPPWRERIPWARMHWFIGDDRSCPMTMRSATAAWLSAYS